jgi:chromate transporter
MKRTDNNLSASEQLEPHDSILETALPASNVSKPPLSHVALLFLRLGFTAFGGPAAHIATMEDEVVRRRHWLTRERFLDLLGAANLIPGPSSTEMAIYIGYTQAGWRGIVLGGACFILPAALITLALAWAYVRFGHLPQISGILYGVKPVVIAIIVQAIWSLRRAAIKNRTQLLVGLLALIVAAVTGRTLSVLVGTGVLMCLVFAVQTGRPRTTLSPAVFPASITSKLAAIVPAAAVVSVSLLSLFLVFFKVGAVVFGSGYVLLAFLKAYLVDQRHWLTNAQLLDAVAVGQVTPGPVFTTATFIGYVLAGLPGAGLATLGIFLPGFLLVAVSGPLIPWLRRSSYASRFLDGVNVAALSLMTVVTWQLGRASIRDWPTLGLAGLSAILLLRYRLNSVWLIAIGATAGLLLARP